MFCKLLKLFTYFFKNAKDLRTKSYEVKLIEDGICSIEVRGKIFTIHEKFIVKVV